MAVPALNIQYPNAGNALLRAEQIKGARNQNLLATEQLKGTKIQNQLNELKLTEPDKERVRQGLEDLAKFSFYVQQLPLEQQADAYAKGREQLVRETPKLKDVLPEQYDPQIIPLLQARIKNAAQLITENTPTKTEIKTGQSIETHYTKPGERPTGKTRVATTPRWEPDKKGRERKKGETRSYQRGNQTVTEEWNGKKWVPLGSGPKWEPDKEKGKGKPKITDYAKRIDTILKNYDTASGISINFGTGEVDTGSITTGKQNAFQAVLAAAKDENHKMHKRAKADLKRLEELYAKMDEVLGLTSETKQLDFLSTATNPETGEKIGWNGKEWLPIPK